MAVALDGDRPGYHRSTWQIRIVGQFKRTTKNRGKATMTRKYDSEFAFRYHRKSTRLSTHNYAWTATYLITIRSAHHEPVFENPALQNILRTTWEALPARFPNVALDEFVIMPDHVHFILRIEGNVEKPVTLARVIGAYKSITTVEWLKYIKEQRLEIPGIIWQRGFHDRVIIDKNALEAARIYVCNNPLKKRDKTS